MLRMTPLLLLLLDFYPTGRDSGWKPWCQGLKTGQFHKGCQCFKGKWLVHQKINSWIITEHTLITTQIFFPEHPINSLKYIQTAIGKINYMLYEVSNTPPPKKTKQKNPQTNKTTTTTKIKNKHKQTTLALKTESFEGSSFGINFLSTEHSEHAVWDSTRSIGEK